MTQLPKTVDYSVGLMSMKQKCLQQFPKTEQWHWHVSHVWWQWVPDGRAGVVTRSQAVARIADVLPKIVGVTWPRPRQLSGKCFVHPLGIPDTKLHTKFEVSISCSFRDIYCILGSRVWPFKVTWRHRSRDHSIAHMPFPIGSPLEPNLYL